MKKFLSTLLIITSLSILYVFQEAKLIEQSYQINSNQKNLTLLIDQNKALRYNMARLEAPARLQAAMAAKEKAGDVIPVACYSIMLEKLPVRAKEAQGMGILANSGRILASMFLINSEAVANESSE